MTKVLSQNGERRPWETGTKPSKVVWTYVLILSYGRLETKPLELNRWRVESQFVPTPLMYPYHLLLINLVIIFMSFLIQTNLVNILEGLFFTSPFFPCCIQSNYDKSL